MHREPMESIRTRLLHVISLTLSVFLIASSALCEEPQAIRDPDLARPKGRSTWMDPRLVVGRRMNVTSAAIVSADSGGRRRGSRTPAKGSCTAGVVTDLVEAYDLAMDDQNIYFVEGEDIIARVSRSGGTPQLLGETPGSSILSLAIDDTRVYFTVLDGVDGMGRICSVPKSGGTVQTLVNNLKTPYDLVVDSQFVYWVALGTFTDEDILADGSIGRALKNGTGVAVLASNLSTPLALAVDATHVYFDEVGAGRGNSSAGLRRVSLTGGSVEKLVDGSAVGTMTLDATSVYFVGVDAGGAVSVNSIPRSGGIPRVLISGLDDASSPKVWDSSLYYSATIGDVTSIEVVSITSGLARTVKVVPLLTPDFLLESCLLYYSTTNSTIERSPR